LFSLEETYTWTAEDALDRLKKSVPEGWRVVHRVDAGWHRITLVNDEGEEQWVREQADAKILFLDALGWLRVKYHKTTHPAWRPRDQEVPLCRPPVGVSAPDPADLDPDEVASVYSQLFPNEEDL
jgi:hypothetical protein